MSRSFLHQTMYSIQEVEARLKKDASIFIMDETFFLTVESKVKSKLERTEGYISEETLFVILKHLQDENQEAWIWLRQLKDRLQASKRSYSTAHKLEVAYKQRYRCARCREMLKPTFQVDHIVELAEGGKDDMENLNALCVECHAEKTRLYQMQKGKLFRTFYKSEYVNFMQYHRKRKRSVYFKVKGL